MGSESSSMLCHRYVSQEDLGLRSFMLPAGSSSLVPVALDALLDAHIPVKTLHLVGLFLKEVGGSFMLQQLPGLEIGAVMPLVYSPRRFVLLMGLQLLHAIATEAPAVATRSKRQFEEILRVVWIRAQWVGMAGSVRFSYTNSCM